MPLTTRHLEFLLEADATLRASMKILVSLFIRFLYGQKPKKASIRFFFHLQRLPLLFAFTFITRCNQTAPLLRQMLMELHTPLQ